MTSDEAPGTGARAVAARASRSPGLPIVAAAALLAVPLLGPSGSQFRLLVNIALFGTMALGLTIIWGFCGQPSFGHAALFGVGAYTVAILTVTRHWDVWPALAVSVATGTLAGLVFALPATRVRTDQLALATFALGEVFRVVELSSGFTGGSNGLSGVGALHVLGHDLLRPDELYRPGLAVLAVGYATTRLLRSSAAGRAMRAVRGDELAARTLGARVLPLKMTAFAVGGGLAGLAGGVYAAFAGFVSSVSFGILASFQVVVMVIIGGVGSPSGAILGAAVVLTLDDQLQTHGSVRLAVTGALMIAAVLVRAGAVRRGVLRLRAALRRRIGSATLDSPATPS